MKRKFTTVIEKHGNWYVAWVKEVAGADTQGKTRAEARRNLKEVLRLVLEANCQLAAQTGATRSG